MRILLIDDEIALREEVEEWLILEGYEVICASNGEEAVKLGFRHMPDLIICDISMPKMNGYDVLNELRSNSSTASVPFIFVTARASLDDIREGLALGADEYVVKPFGIDELLDAIQKCLHKK